MKAYVFPGQGSQFVGMGKDLYEQSDLAKSLFEKANDILGFRITDILFEGTLDQLKETKVTQPAIFLHSVILSKVLGVDFTPEAVAGHSLGEFSALVAVGALSFEDGLQLVSKRALAMQAACDKTSSTMAAVLGLSNELVEEVCTSFQDGQLVAANYNCPGQLVVSGSEEAIKKAEPIFKEKGAKRVVVLPVSGGFHSPFMLPAQEELAKAIEATTFHAPKCPVYQNVVATAVSDPEVIKQNLLKQLTGAVKWTQTIEQMISDGFDTFEEVGPGKVLQGLIKKTNRQVTTSGAVALSVS